MDNLDLDALRALHEKATPGPWHFDQDPRRGMEDNTFICAGRDDLFFPSDREGAHDDAELIVAARNAIPRLLALVEAADMALMYGDGWAESIVHYQNTQGGGASRWAEQAVEFRRLYGTYAALRSGAPK